ncbi:MAG TPA: peptidoglycan DD-metalloendopeptidase family protein [Longimicrobiales bacterium]
MKRPVLRRLLPVTTILAVAVIAACGDAPTGVEDRPDPQFATVAADGTGGDVLFGPRRFLRARGVPTPESVTVAGADFASFEAPFVLKIRNGAEDGSQRVSSAWIWVDSTLVFGPNDFSQQVADLEREVDLREGSALTVLNAGAPGAFLDIRIEANRAGGRVTLGPAGGTVEVPELARFEFPAGFFETERVVEVARVEDEAALENFIEFQDLFRVGSRTSYQVRLLAGTTIPDDGRFTAVLSVPASMTIPTGHRPELFARVYEDIGMEVLDNFQLIASVYDPAARTLTATLPAWVFTDARRSDGQFEALFMIGTTPGGVSTTASALGGAAWNIGLAQAGDPAECKAALIGNPLDGEFPVASPYGERVHPTKGTTRMHWGTDLAAPTGTTVLAVADGRIERIRNQGDGVGYGLYMIVRHTDGSASLYAHLESTTAVVGQEVQRGDPIAVSDNTGDTSGPHLHLEYVPNGEIVRNKERIDPFPCIQEENVSGSITVRDNGSAADDAFAVFLDGIHIGTTDIGAANSFALNNLIPGEHTLGVQAVIAPDGVGTVEIILSDGITFANGTTRISGTLPPGGLANLTIIVPSEPTATIAPALLMRPNEYREGDRAHDP